ncbi:MAG: MBL fold metallo-hydrolase [Deltaproteobacteria bacterium]|jgi:flavorubredoxin|nr:MBL fold metallo-hydrolase [Deltaproteobacteria bacterium]
MEPIKITDSVYWVGAIDYDIRDFHGYLTPKGSTYNAYLIVNDKKITLIDTVKHGFEEELLSRVSKIVDPKKIDQVVSNHAEMDHSGGLPGILRHIGLEKPVYASSMGVKNLGGQFQGAGLNLKAVESKLDVGEDLVFIETRMIHWPDSMFSFLPAQGLLFSQDGFGMHLACPERFDDQVDEKTWGPLALNYFANILTPYTVQIAKVLEKVVAEGLAAQFKILCPDHGFIWRQNPGRILELYSQWVQQKPSQKAVIVFDTMWHSTEFMARVLTDYMAGQGIETRYHSLKNTHRSEVATDCYEAAAIIIGTPTINNQLFPSVSDFITYIKSLKFKNKIGGAFGSYGWSGEGAKLVQSELKTMGYQVPADEVRYQWVPQEKDLDPLKALGKTIADEIKKL